MKLELTIKELEILDMGLQSLPYKLSAPVINSINLQLDQYEKESVMLEKDLVKQFVDGSDIDYTQLVDLDLIVNKNDGWVLTPKGAALLASNLNHRSKAP